MISRYEAYLNNIALSSVDPKILILDIQYSTPSIKNEGYTLAKRNGTYIYDRYTDKTSVSIRLRCICDAFPTIASARNWTDALQIVFTAYALPYWEEEFEKTLTLTGTSANGTLYVPGNVDGALITASIKANAALSSVNLTANGKTLSLTGLSVSSGQTINITYDNALIQSIKVGSTSLLNKRTGADDLLAKCGENNVLSVSASASVNATFKVRGLWL